MQLTGEGLRKGPGALTHYWASAYMACQPRIGAVSFLPSTGRNKSADVWQFLPDQEEVWGACVVAALPAMLLVLGSLGRRTVTEPDGLAS